MNSDRARPYGFLGAGLRSEPLVISVPAVPKDRYYPLQAVDMYTHHFAYVGSRATGSEAADYVLEEPGGQGQAPAGIKSVIRSETSFAFVLYRTQLFGGSDLEAVKGIQAQYQVRPLSRFAGTAPPPPSRPSTSSSRSPRRRDVIDTGKKSSADGFGTREFLRNDYLTRMSSAVVGIYGSSREEANSPAYFLASEGTVSVAPPAATP